MYQAWIGCATKNEGDHIAILASQIESVEEMRNIEDNTLAGCIITLLSGRKYYVADTYDRLWGALTVVSK